MKPTNEVLEKFDTQDLHQILYEFFNNDGIDAEFGQLVLDYKEIADVDKFFREFAIEHIRDEVSFEDLVESGWCFEDEQ